MLLLSRLRSQRLHPRRRAPLVQRVRELFAVQAQSLPYSALALHARTAAQSRDDVDRARAAREVVWTWCMRGTLHLLAPEDVRWLVRLTGPPPARPTPALMRRLGFSSESFAAGIQTVREILAADGPLTRAEIREQLGRRGVNLEYPQTTYILVRNASLAGLVCAGPDRGSEATYVLLDDWIPGAGEGPSGEAALAELARRFLTAYGPAEPADLAAWSGLAGGVAKKAFELVAGELREHDALGRRVWTLGALGRTKAPNAPVVRLLPAWDTYLLGYRERAAMLDARHAPLVMTGGGWVKAIVTIDGRAVALWRTERRGGRVQVEIERFAGEAVEAAGLRREVAAVERFLS